MFAMGSPLIGSFMNNVGFAISPEFSRFSSFLFLMLLDIYIQADFPMWIHAQTSALMKTQTSDVKTCNGQSLGCISHLSEECGSGQ